VVVFTGSPSGTNTVTIAPNTAQKTYWVRNTTAQTVVLSQGTGSTVSVPSGTTKAVFTDGGGATAAVVDLTDVLAGSFLGDLDSNGPYRGNLTAVAVLDVDTSSGNYFTKTVSANSAFTFSGAPASRSYSFTLEINHTSGAITWPAEVEFPRGQTPNITAGNVHLFMFVTSNGGTTWRGAALADYEG